MEQFTFKTFAFGGELDLNRLAVKLGITRKYRWEEPMKPNPGSFALATGSDAERVYLYYFGGVFFSTVQVISSPAFWTAFLNMPSL